jgi:HEPN domain-containing protein
MPEVEFTAQSYRRAALEHLRYAGEAHNTGAYFYSHYFSGLSVECMLRAYRLKISREFDSRHDLYELAKSARFLNLVPFERQAEYGSKFNILNLRWRSNQRYMTEKQLRKYLGDLRADFDKKGDRFKNNSSTIYELAYEIVTLGDRKWTL